MIFTEKMKALSDKQLTRLEEMKGKTISVVFDNSEELGIAFTDGTFIALYADPSINAMTSLAAAKYIVKGLGLLSQKDINSEFEAGQEYTKAKIRENDMKLLANLKQLYPEEF